MSRLVLWGLMNGNCRRADPREVLALCIEDTVAGK